jgi:hypothetical protein
MNIEKRVFKGYVEKRSLILLPDDKESKLVDWLVGDEVGHDGYIGAVEGIVKLSDGSGEHYIEISRGGWISCKERLPIDTKKYMVYSPKWGQLTQVLWQGRWMTSKIPPTQITHWREHLPPPPEDNHGQSL